jgi:hypothetical protein
MATRATRSARRPAPEKSDPILQKFRREAAGRMVLFALGMCKLGKQLGVVERLLMAALRPRARAPERASSMGNWAGPSRPDVAGRRAARLFSEADLLDICSL